MFNSVVLFQRSLAGLVLLFTSKMLSLTCGFSLTSDTWLMHLLGSHWLTSTHRCLSCSEYEWDQKLHAGSNSPKMLSMLLPLLTPSVYLELCAIDVAEREHSKTTYAVH